MMPNFTRTALLGFLCLLLPTTTHALSIKRPQWPTLVQKASLIVKAKVSTVTQVAYRGLPMKESRFQVLQTLKGTHIKQVHVRLPGGTYKGAKLQLSGIPSFSPGQVVYLFLRPTSTKAQAPLLLIALYFGVFDVKPNKHGQPEVHSRGQLLPKTPERTFQHKVTQTILSQSKAKQTPGQQQ